MTFLLFIQITFVCLLGAMSPGPSMMVVINNAIFKNRLNEETNLIKYEGKLLLMNFWATWCRPCLVELPHLNAIDKKYEDKGVDVVVISIDAAREVSKAKAYIKSRKYQFTALFDTETSVVSQYNPSKAIPFTLIIDREMRIVHTHTGYVAGVEDTYIQILDDLTQ